MTWGVLEDKRNPRPPGTIILDHDQAKNQPSDDDASTLNGDNLKRHGKTILQPQPSDSPNDPLNWSTRVKAGIFFVIIITITAIGGIQSMLGTAGRILAERYDVSYPQLIRTLQPPGIAAGAIALVIFSAIGSIWGKRLPILVSVTVVWIMMIVGYFANSLKYYQAVTIILNIFTTAPELLSAPLVTDLIYVHQRGKIMAFSAVVAIVGIDLSSIISGNIIVHLGVKYLYIISFCVMAVLVGANFFLMRETTYTRAPPRLQAAEKTVSHESDLSGETLMTPTGEARHSADLTPSSTRNSINKEEAIEVESNVETKHPWTWYLRIWQGRLTERSLIKALLRPFPLMIFPSVLFSTIVNGAMLTWVVISSIISGQVLLYPPYNLQPDTLSYLSLPMSAAALISSLVSGVASDWQIKYMARKNGGVYEPEYRLVMLIPGVVFSTVGFLLLGPLYKRHAPVYQIVLANTLFSIGMPFGASACTTYILDTMQNSASEAFVATTLFKSLYMFLATFYVPTWFAQNGAIYTYRALAILNVCFGLAGIPMYVLGKRWRAVTSRSAFLRRTAGHDIE